MTDDRPVPLDALRLEPHEEAAILGAVMSRVREATRSGRSGREPRLLPLVVATLAAAAAVVGAMMLEAPRRDTGETLVSIWLEEQRVPTNAELLAAFRGYTP